MASVKGIKIKLDEKLIMRIKELEDGIRETIEYLDQPWPNIGDAMETLSELLNKGE